MNKEIIELFKDSYRDMVAMDLSRLDRLYTDNLVFKDPVHEIRGLPAMQDYMAEMVANVEECRFEFLDQLMADGTAYIKWNMHFRHPKLAAGQLISVRGVSQLQFDERIHYHEDVYDMGAMVYEHVPVIGGVTRWLKNRLAS
ncbi:MAG: esterase/lipase superfamily enzyme [Oceanicoccus sp.]|jgi:esterase/lipase superfamily enzyme